MPPVAPTAISPSPLSTERASLARHALLHAVLLGILADAFLRQGPDGLGLSAWMVCFAGSLLALAWRRGDGLPREQRAWLTAAVALAAGLAWRDAGALQGFDFLGMVVALALLGVTTSAASFMHSILGARVRDLAATLARAAVDAGTGVVPLVVVDSAFGGSGRLATGRARLVVRAALLTIPVLLVFGILLSQADPLFGSLFRLPDVDLDVVMSHIVLAGFFTWIVGGWLRGALVDTRPRTRLPDGMPIALGTIDVTSVLGALNVLFAIFVAVQIGWLFGGERLVRSTTGLGYAEYARRGFFELIWVSLLVLPVLLGTHAAIPATDDRARRWHRRLAVPLLILVGAIMLSALGRMTLYVHYYGLTRDRLFATVFMGWLAVVFGWLAVTVLRNRARDFAAGMTITGFLTLAAVNVANPDALIARVNIARAQDALAIAGDAGAASRGASADSVSSPIDFSYLTKSLDGEAVPAIVDALRAPPVSGASTPVRGIEVEARCRAVRTLFVRWTDDPQTGANAVPPQRDWRRWNYGWWRARRIVREHEGELRRVACRDAGGEAPFGARERRAALPGEQWYVAPKPPQTTDLPAGQSRP